jgi:two-component system phosphate regulon response regulator PhoB
MQPRLILIADDDWQLQQLMAMALRHAGYDVECAGDARSAEALARKRPPDLLLLDVHMPAGDGFVVQKHLRSVPGLSDIPVIYVTGDVNYGTAILADEAGAAEMIIKPFEMDELVEVVADVLDRAAQPESP